MAMKLKGVVSKDLTEKQSLRVFMNHGKEQGSVLKFMIKAFENLLTLYYTFKNNEWRLVQISCSAPLLIVLR
jgi:hypothetical protein